MSQEQVDRAWLDVARMAGRQDRDMEVHELRAENERLRADNTALRSIANQIQGHLEREEQRTYKAEAENERLQTENARLRAAQVRETRHE